MARKLSAMRLWSEYLLVSSLAFVLRVLPLRAAVALGRVLGVAYCAVDRRHRTNANTRIRDAYGPDLPEAEVGRIVRDMYRHFGVMMAEFVRIPATHRRESRPVHRLERLRPAGLRDSWGRGRASS